MSLADLGMVDAFLLVCLLEETIDAIVEELEGYEDDDDDVMYAHLLSRLGMYRTVLAKLRRRRASAPDPTEGRRDDA